MSACHSSRPALLCVVLVALLVTAACKDEGGVKVTSLKFNGLEAVEPAQLTDVLATGASSQLPWGEKRYFSREQFEADLKRIVAFYRDRGYPDAKVTSFDVRLSEDQTSVDIVLNIAEGEPVVAQRVALEGFDVLPDASRNSLAARLPLQEGQPLDRSLMQASREAALEELKEEGYPYASVRMGDTEGDGGSGRVVTLTAEPGPVARHGELSIQGNSSVSDNVIRRQLTFKPGDIFRQSKLLESQRKLYALEVFQFANVQTVREEGEKPTDIPTRITVTEGKHRKVNFSLGYGTEEKARVEADWRHVNFFGGARTAGIRTRYSGLDSGVKLNFNQPYFLSPRYSLGMQGQFWRNDEPGFFTLYSVGGRATMTREFGGRQSAVFGSRAPTTLSLTYANEWEDYTISNEALEDFELRDDLIALGLDPRSGTGRGQRSAISIDGGRNTTNNVLDAKRGYVAALHLEQAGAWLGGDYDYYEFTAEGRYYFSIADRAVVAVMARGGTIDDLGSASVLQVPFYKRYFLGGATNLRGWGRYDVAPLSGAGFPLGGHSFANFSTEVRVPLFGNLGGVLFFDGGNVWSDPWGFDTSDLRYDVGPGIRYNTPIGPIRADLGYQLNPIPGLLVNGKPEPRRFRFHFSIGQAF